MFFKRKRQESDGIAPPQSCAAVSSTSRLFRPGAKHLIQRAPLFSMTSIGIEKKFQRPSLKRRVYGKQAEAALQSSCLGQRRRLNGMAKLMARAGQGLSFQLPSSTKQHDSNTDSESDDEAKIKEPDVPYEPLILWTSPHQGGAAVGLPKTVYVTSLFIFV
jgi:hypothetical protein